MRSRAQMLGLVAEVAVAGLEHSALSAADRADVYDGLSILLPRAEAEAAKYAATCIRECQRAQQDFLDKLKSRKGAE